jgi:hypothetical protein
LLLEKANYKSQLRQIWTKTVVTSSQQALKRQKNSALQNLDPILKGVAPVTK